MKVAIESAAGERSTFEVKVIASNARLAGAALAGEPVFRNDLRIVEGMVVLGRVLGHPGSIAEIENVHARDVRLYPGDCFIGVVANRHSSTSEYGEVPVGLELERAPVLDLLARGGIVGRGAMVGAPPFTKVELLGALSREGRAQILSELSEVPVVTPSRIAPVLLVGGTAAEVGKTTTCAGLIRAFKRRGLQVGATKLSGTGRMRDIVAMREAGADFCMDFPDAGLASTYTEHEAVLQVAQLMLARLTSHGCDILVAELGGDIIEANNPALLDAGFVREATLGIVHVAADVIGLIGSIEIYRSWGLAVPIYATLPRGRNRAGTLRRLRERHLDAIDPRSDSDCDALAERLLVGTNVTAAA